MKTFLIIAGVVVALIILGLINNAIKKYSAYKKLYCNRCGTEFRYPDDVERVSTITLSDTNYEKKAKLLRL